MDKYSKKYMEEHCIDVFFKCGKFPIHVLTAGSLLPDALNDIVRNRTLQQITEAFSSNGPGAPTISVNKQYVQLLLGKWDSYIEYGNQKNHPGHSDFLQRPDEEKITSRFRFYAGQGFYSYDCSEVYTDGTAEYRLMAWPDTLSSKTTLDLPEFSPAGFGAANPPDRFVM